MSNLEMFTNETDYIIAESPEEAVKILREQVGIEDDETEEFGSMDKTLAFSFRPDPDDQSNVITKTVAEWIQEFGKGYFACSEY